MAPDTIELSPIALKDPSLLRQQCYVDGKWIDADDGGSMPVVDPATGMPVGTAPVMHAAETRRAIDAANRALPAWRSKTAKERCAILRKWQDLMLAHVDDLALILTAEQGKPLAEAKGEIDDRRGVRRVVRRGSASASTATSSPTTGERSPLVVVKQPVGVCAAITPWNFPAR